MKLTSYLVGGSFVALLGLAAPMSASAGSIVGTLGISGGIIYDTQGLPGSGSSIIEDA